MLADEINVKDLQIEALNDSTPLALGLELRITVDARAAGPRLGKDVQRVIRAVKANDGVVWTGDAVTAAGVQLHQGEFRTEWVSKSVPQGWAVGSFMSRGQACFVALDTALDAELVAEGWARDVVRQVQDERKAAGLHVSDTVLLELGVPAEREEATRAHTDLIAREVLAQHVTISVLPELAEGDGVRVGLEKVA